MASSSTLLQLIRSMSKSEKRYFKLFSELQMGQKEYIKLFNLLEKGKLQSKDIRVKYDQINSGTSFESARKYLYKILIKSIISFNSERNLDIKLFNKISEIKILVEKELFIEALYQIDKVKSQTIQYEKSFHFLMIARLEMQILASMEFENETESSLVKKQAMITSYLDHEQSINQHSSLYELLYLRLLDKGIARSLDEKNRLNDLAFLESQLLSKPQYYNLFESKKLHLLFQSVFFRIAGDFKKSLEVYSELEKLFEANKKLWQGAEIYYLHILRGILNNLRFLGKSDEIDYFLLKLESPEIASSSVKMQAIYTKIQFELINLIDKGKWNEALKKSTETLSEKNPVYKDLTLSIRNSILFNAAKASFFLGEYSDSLKYLNDIIYNKENNDTIHVYNISRILFLINHFENDNHEFLLYETRSFQRNLVNRNKLFKTESLIIKLIKNLIISDDYSFKVKLIEGSIQKLKHIKSDRFESHLFYMFDISYWLDDLLKNKFKVKD